MNGGQRGEAELWERVFGVTRAVVRLADEEAVSAAEGGRYRAGQAAVRDGLLEAALAVGQWLVRAHAADSAAEFVRRVRRARLAAIEADFWLRLWYVTGGVSIPAVSQLMSQYAAVIEGLEVFGRVEQTEAAAESAADL